MRDQGGAVSVSWAMRNVMDVNSRRERDGNTDETNVASAKAKPDVMWAASDIGWVVGHTFIVYGPLLVGGSTVMYEGKPVGTPDAGMYVFLLVCMHVYSIQAWERTYPVLYNTMARHSFRRAYKLSDIQTFAHYYMYMHMHMNTHTCMPIDTYTYAYMRAHAYRCLLACHRRVRS